MNDKLKIPITFKSDLTMALSIFSVCRHIEEKPNVLGFELQRCSSIDLSYV